MPHRDTLAYLCAHWQHVVANAARNRMPAEALAMALGPVVVGVRSVVGDSAEEMTRQQADIMLQLLQMPAVRDSDSGIDWNGWACIRRPVHDRGSGRHSGCDA